MIDTVVIIFNFSTKMNKIINSFDYVFYRCYRFFSSHRIFRGMETIDSISTIFLSLFIPLAVIVGCVGHRTGMIIEKYSLQYYTILALIFLIGYAPLIQRYMFNKSISKDKYQVFKDKWGKENRKQRKKRGWYIVLFIINNIIVFPIVVAVLIHHVF